MLLLQRVSLLSKQFVYTAAMMSTATDLDPQVLGTVCDTYLFLDMQYFFSLLDAKITKITNLSPTVKGFTAHISKPAKFRAGQWVDVFLPGVDMVGNA